MPTLPDYPGASDTDQISNSPIRVTKSPGRQGKKRIKYIFETYFGRFLAFWGKKIGYLVHFLEI